MEHSGLRVYEDAARMSASGRALEANVLFKAARQLEACQRAWDAADRNVQLQLALAYNRRLWSFFQSELSRPDHELDAQVRLNILSISSFIDRRTFEMIAQPDKQKLQALIDINRNLAAGLGANAASKIDPAPAFNRG